MLNMLPIFIRFANRKLNHKPIQYVNAMSVWSERKIINITKIVWKWKLKQTMYEMAQNAMSLNIDSVYKWFNTQLFQ